MQLRTTVAFTLIAGPAVFAIFAAQAHSADGPSAAASTTTNAKSAKASPGTAASAKRKPHAIARNMDDLSDGNYRVKASPKKQRTSGAKTAHDAKVAPGK